MAWSSFNLTANVMASFFVLPVVTARRLADDFGVTNPNGQIGTAIYRALEALESAGLIEECDEVADGVTTHKGYRLAQTNAITHGQKLMGEVKRLNHALGVSNRRVLELLEQQKTWEQVKRLVETAQ